MTDRFSEPGSEVISPSYNIEPMQQGDLEEAARLLLEGLGPESPVKEPWTLDTAYAHLEGVWDPSYSLVARGNDGSVVGIAVCFEETFERGPELYIDALFVSKDINNKE